MALFQTASTAVDNTDRNPQYLGVPVQVESFRPLPPEKLVEDLGHLTPSQATEFLKSAGLLEQINGNINPLHAVFDFLRLRKPRMSIMEWDHILNCWSAVRASPEGQNEPYVNAYSRFREWLSFGKSVCNYYSYTEFFFPFQ